MSRPSGTFFRHNHSKGLDFYRVLYDAKEKKKNEKEKEEDEEEKAKEKGNDDSFLEIICVDRF